MAEVLLDNLTQRYPGAPANTVSDLNIRIADGEAHALLGSSGAGKTTLLGLLSGLLPSTSGSISFDGRDVTALSARQRNVAQVFQFPVLYEAMSVAQNLGFPLVTLGWRAKDVNKAVHRLAEQLQLVDLLRKKPAQLGLYQKQFVAVGRALIRPDTSLVLLDEPLTAVEPALKWRLRSVLKAYQTQTAKTMIYVTHDQTEALTFADRISILHDGQVLQSASPEVLLSAPEHEWVGHFIGSPGMNLLDCRIHHGEVLLDDTPVCRMPGTADGPARLGFRPDWVTLASHPPGIVVEVRRARTMGIDAGRPVGLIEAVVAGHRFLVSQPLLGTPKSGRAYLRIQNERALLFRNGKRVHAPGE